MRLIVAAALLPVLLLAALPSRAQTLSGPPGAIAPGGTLWRSDSARAGDYNSALEYGVVADGYTAADGSITAGTNSFSSTSKNCAAADAGKVLTVSGAGAVDGSGALDPLVTTVTGCSGNAFTLAADATTTQAGVPWAYGTDNAAALAAAVAHYPAVLRLPPGDILLNGAGIALWNIALECARTPSPTHDYVSASPGSFGTTFLLTSLTNQPFNLGYAVRIEGCNFYWPGQSGLGRNKGAYPAQPILSAGTGGSLASGTYYAEITFLTAGVESPRSIETSISVAASGTLTVSLPSGIATGADHWNFYAAASSGAEVLQNATPIAIGTTSDTISSLTTGTAGPPAPFVPVAFPPLLRSNASGYVNDALVGNTVLNAYDFLVECNAAGDPVASCTEADGGGNVRITGSDLFAVHRVFTLSNVGDTWRLIGNHSNAALFTQPAYNSGIAGNLATWWSENADWLYVEGNGSAGGACSSRITDGLAMTNNGVIGPHIGIHVGNGDLSESSFRGGDLAAEIPLQIDPAGSGGYVDLDARYVSIRSGSAAPAATAFAFNSTCTGFPGGHQDYSIKGFSEQSEGSLIDIEGTGTLRINVTGLVAEEVGNSNTAGNYYVAKLNDASATLNVTGLLATANAAGVGGILGAAGTLNLGQYSIGVSASPLTVTGAAVHAAPASNFNTGTPGNVTGTSSGGGVMMGYCARLTPKTTGNVEAVFDGSLTNTTAGDGAAVWILYGTGACPSNGGAVTGTATGALIEDLGGGTNLVPFSSTTILGLTVGTQYWFDLVLYAKGGGTASVQNLNWTLHEM